MQAMLSYNILAIILSSLYCSQRLFKVFTDKMCFFTNSCMHNSTQVSLIPEGTVSETFNFDKNFYIHVLPEAGVLRLWCKNIPIKYKQQNIKNLMQ